MIMHGAPTQVTEDQPRKHNMPQKWFLATALALTSMTAAAHDAAAVSQHPSPPATPMAQRAVVGLPIFTSDGEEIGKALATGTDEDGLAVVVAQIERPLGTGSIAVAIPTYMFMPMTDRIVLAITEAEVGQRLDRAAGGKAHTQTRRHRAPKS
jgi:hypothetical protein